MCAIYLKFMSEENAYQLQRQYKNCNEGTEWLPLKTLH